jgi:hypothetical protein
MTRLSIQGHFLCVLSVTMLLGACTQQTSVPPSGEALYRRYCASCHGVAGKGDGPLVASLRRPPADLTTLALRTGGHFDEAEVMAMIDGRRAVAAHGPREMPVWGVVFSEELKDQPYTEYTGLRQAQILAEYLHTLQEQ